MRIVYFGNNWVGWKALERLREQGDEFAALVLHPPEKQRYAREMLAVAGLPPERVFDGSRLRRPETLAAIRALSPEIGLSVLFGYILRPELLALFPRGVVNLHPAYLPCNRGQYPNVWSIVERTPAGVTLHYIDGGIDTGDIIARREVPIEPIDTGETLYRKLERASLELLSETWPAVRSGAAPRVPQPESERATSHRTADVARIDEIDLARPYVAKDLLDVLRARTFPPYRGAYFTVGGRRVYLRLQLEYEGTT